MSVIQLQFSISLIQFSFHASHRLYKKKKSKVVSGLFVSVLPVLTPHLCSASSALMALLGSGLAFDRSSILAIHTPTLFMHDCVHLDAPH